MDRELSDETILQSFLMEFYFRQGSYLQDIPKVVLGRDWDSAIHLSVDWTSRKHRRVSCEQFTHEIIIPAVEAMVSRVKAETNYCDLLLFHTLFIPPHMDGNIVNLAGMSARILAVDKTFEDISRIDISFSPMWLRR